jgi:hypothetical protein
MLKRVVELIATSLLPSQMLENPGTIHLVDSHPVQMPINGTIWISQELPLVLTINAVFNRLLSMMEVVIKLVQI